MALDPEHAGKHLAIGFVAGGLAYAVLVALYALAGWYHVERLQLDLGALLWSGFIGTLILNGFLEEIVFQGVIFRLLEARAGLDRGAGALDPDVRSHPPDEPGRLADGRLSVAAGGGVVFTCAYLLTGSLWLAIGLHWAADFWQGPVFGLHPPGQTFAHPLVHSVVAGPHLWTGGIFGGGLVALMLVVPVSAAIVVAVAKRHGFRAPPTNLVHALTLVHR